MAYLIAIGAFPHNKGGFGSRGWHIWRLGTEVHVEHGGVKIENHRIKSVRWDGHPTEIWPPQRMRTVKRAIAEVKRQIALKLKGAMATSPTSGCSAATRSCRT